MFGTAKVALVSGVGPGMGRSIALGLARGRGRGPGLPPGGAARGRRRRGPCPRSGSAGSADRHHRPEACQRLVAAAGERFGGIDILVQNGHHEGDRQPVADADPDEWRRIFEVNLYGALHLVQAVIPVMRERGGGSIIPVNSGAAVRTPPTMGAYSTSKAALAALTRTLAVEAGRWQIRVNGVYLGPVLGENLIRQAGRRGAHRLAANRINGTWMRL